MKHLLKNLSHHPPDFQLHPTFFFHRKCVSFQNEQNTWTQNGHGPMLFLSAWAKAPQLPLVGAFLHSEDQRLPASMTYKQDLPNEKSTFKKKTVRFVWICTLVYSPIFISHSEMYMWTTFWVFRCIEIDLRAPSSWKQRVWLAESAGPGRITGHHRGA